MVRASAKNLTFCTRNMFSSFWLPSIRQRWDDSSIFINTNRSSQFIITGLLCTPIGHPSLALLVCYKHQLVIPVYHYWFAINTSRSSLTPAFWLCDFVGTSLQSRGVGNSRLPESGFHLIACKSSRSFRSPTQNCWKLSKIFAAFPYDRPSTRNRNL